ncbi:MAG: sigma-70 region 4 domain protein [Nocardioides sp.]|uniref:sigma-70 family RNA polymerase sigma factor n=1 Tax=Nocardioides sp. TaxID=35761 RepID=UPI002619AD58|nr:sigma-70 family RNA polymerase sigma factor [Nocardioides sp.]MCW2833317.1 sigma-70 region 4 domain protein [Nocardioides sp.]
MTIAPDRAQDRAVDGTQDRAQDRDSVAGLPPSPFQDRSRCTARLLAAAAGTDDDARKQELWDEAVTFNSRVARAMARRFAGRGIDREDLEQVAFEGLIKAVRRFDPSSEHDFMSFAVPTIRGEIQRHFRDLGWMVRPTRWVQETQWRAVRVEEELTATLGRPPRSAELIEALGISEVEYAEVVSANGCFRPTSLDQPVTSSDSGQELGDLLSQEDDALDACEARAMVLPAVRDLTERERRVVYLRFFEQRTQHEIADEIGVGQAQVSRILNRVLADLRERLTADAPVDEVGAMRSRTEGLVRVQPSLLGAGRQNHGSAPQPRRGKSASLRGTGS